MMNDRSTLTPKKGWVMTQTWNHLAFLHWSCSPDVLRPMIPKEFELDTFDGRAWIGIIPFRLSHIRLRFSPPIPWMSSFPEINVRTYVKYKNHPGVYFIRLDASHPFIIKIARMWYHIPYSRAKVSFQNKGEVIGFQSCTNELRGPTESFHGVYKPSSAPFIAKSGTIEHWLTERYTFYSQSPLNSNLYFGHVYHDPWKLHACESEIAENTLLQTFSIDAPTTPEIQLYSRGVKSFFGRVHRLM